MITLLSSFSFEPPPQFPPTPNKVSCFPSIDTDLSTGSCFVVTRFIVVTSSQCHPSIIIFNFSNNNNKIIKKLPSHTKKINIFYLI